MAFDPKNLALMVDDIGGAVLRWFAYTTEDNFETVVAPGYFTQAAEAGAREGDSLLVSLPTGILEGRIGSNGTFSSLDASDINVTPEKFGAVGDGVTDDGPAINRAMAYLDELGGGVIQFSPKTYGIGTTLVVPRVAGITFAGTGYHRAPTEEDDASRACTELKAIAAIQDLIRWEGTSPRVLFTDLAKSFAVRGMILNGNSLVTRANIYAADYDTLIVELCRLIRAPQNIISKSAQAPIGSFPPGGLRVTDCNLGALSGADIDMDGNTQNWLRGNWFASTASSPKIRMSRCDKVNIVDCEFNLAGATDVVFLLEDDGDNSTHDINIVASKINCGGATAKVFQDDRTHAESIRVSFVGATISGGVALQASDLHNPQSNAIDYTRNTTGLSYRYRYESDFLKTGSAAIDASAGSQRPLSFTTNDSLRWKLLAGTGAESGSNAGSDFVLQRFDDAGVLIGTAMEFKRDTGQFNFTRGSGTASGGAVTINASHGRITTEALTTAAGATTTITLTNNKITNNTQIVCQVRSYSGAGTPIIFRAQTSNGSASIVIKNVHASAALDTSLLFEFITMGY